MKKNLSKVEITSAKNQITNTSFTAKIIFNNVNWFYVISSILLLFLPVINFPLTSRYGYDYQFRFFLDPTLLSNLDPTRNLLHYIAPLPIYIFIGVIPGVVGLIIILYVILNSFPKIIHFSASMFRLSELRFGIPVKHDFDNDSLQMLNIGNKRMSTHSWLLFSALVYLAAVIWSYGFDSVLSNGSWFYFTIEQWVWDNTEMIFTINLGFHLFITVLVLIIAGLIIVVFPRKNVIIETSDFQIKFPYHSLHLKESNFNTLNEQSSIFDAFTIYLKTSNKNMSNDNDINSNIKTQNSMIKTQSVTFIPHLKISLLGISLFSLFLIIFLPGFFFGDFLFPFGMVGFVTLLFLTLRTLFYECYSKQKLSTPNQDFLTIRYNPLSGKQLFYVFNLVNINYEQDYSKNRHFLLLFGTIMIWEIFVVFSNMIQFITYFLTNPWTFLHLSLSLLYLLTLIYVVFDRPTNASITPEKQRNLREKRSENLKDSYHISFNSQISTAKEELRIWYINLKQNFTLRKIKENLTPMVFFIIPLTVFIVWLIFYITHSYPIFVYFLL